MDNLYSALSYQMVKNKLRVGINYSDFISIEPSYSLSLSSSFPVIRVNFASGDINHLQFVVSGFHDFVTVIHEKHIQELTKQQFLDLISKEHVVLFEWMLWNLLGIK